MTTKDLQNLVVESLSDLIDYKIVKLEEVYDRLMATIACHGSYRGGDKMSRFEIDELVLELFQTAKPYSCPHGRPVIWELTKYELEKSLEELGKKYDKLYANTKVYNETKIQIIVYIILIVIFLSYLMWNKYGSQIRTYQLRQEYIRSMQSLAYIHNSTVACASMRVESDCICNDDRSWQVTCFDKKIKIADSEIQIAVATNTSEQNEGMMEFRELPVNYGMLFTFRIIRSEISG